MRLVTATITILLVLSGLGISYFITYPVVMTMRSSYNTSYQGMKPNLPSQSQSSIENYFTAFPTIMGVTIFILIVGVVVWYYLYIQQTEYVSEKA